MEEIVGFQPLATEEGVEMSQAEVNEALAFAHTAKITIPQSTFDRLVRIAEVASAAHHGPEYQSTGDEVWKRNPVCSCGQPWDMCDEAQALWTGVGDDRK